MVKGSVEQSLQLNIYDWFRDMHQELRYMQTFPGYEGISEWEKNAFAAVDAVLYLAEGVFVQAHLKLNEPAGRPRKGERPGTEGRR